MNNWKTSVIGLLAALSLAFGGMAKDRATNPNASPLTSGNVLPALAVAALGYYASDKKD